MALRRTLRALGSQPLAPWSRPLTPRSLSTSCRSHSRRLALTSLERWLTAACLRAQQLCRREPQRLGASCCATAAAADNTVWGRASTAACTDDDDPWHACRLVCVPACVCETHSEHHSVVWEPCSQSACAFNGTHLHRRPCARCRQMPSFTHLTTVASGAYLPHVTRALPAALQPPLRGGGTARGASRRGETMLRQASQLAWAGLAALLAALVLEVCRCGSGWVRMRSRWREQVPPGRLFAHAAGPS